MKFSKRLIKHIADEYYSGVTEDIEEQKALAEEYLFAAQEYFNDEHIISTKNIEEFFNDWDIPFTIKNYHMFIDNYREVNGWDRYDDMNWKRLEKIGYIVCLLLLIFAALRLLFQ